MNADAADCLPGREDGVGVEEVGHLLQIEAVRLRRRPGYYYYYYYYYNYHPYHYYLLLLLFYYYYSKY